MNIYFDKIENDIVIFCSEGGADIDQAIAWEYILKNDQESIKLEKTDSGLYCNQDHLNDNEKFLARELFEIYLQNNQPEALENFNLLSNKQ